MELFFLFTPRLDLFVANPKSSASNGGIIVKIMKEELARPEGLDYGIKYPATSRIRP